MRWWWILLIVTLVIVTAIAVHGVGQMQDGRDLDSDNEFAVLLAYNPDQLEKYEFILNAYESVLQEEGIPTHRFSIEDFYNTEPEEMAKTKQVLIFPDGINRVLPMDIRFWIYPYIQAGGNVAVIYDVGVLDRKGTYRAKAPFADLLGISYVTYNDLETDSYTYGMWRISDPDKRDYLEIPFGKVSPEGTVSSYSYGELTYPVARIKELAPLAYDEVYGSVVLSKDEQYPAVVIRDHGAGSALYVNLPLGHLKAHSDDLPLRSVMRMFLLQEVGLPHLVPLPFNKPGIVLNWHIDDKTEWTTSPRMIQDGIMKSILEYSIHITAGDFNESSGDGLGFDACGPGGSSVVRESMMPFGVVGSHGGWGHNWFSEQMGAKLFTLADMEHYIKINNDCIAKTTGRPVTEYSAPNGAFPQPEGNRLMEKLGIIAYYNTADTGSAPNRTFVNREQPTTKAISFPIMPFYQAASLYEIGEEFNYAPEEIQNWFEKTFQYVVDHRTIRLMYTHPYDVYLHLTEEQRVAVKAAMDTLEEKQKQGELQVRSMTYFADYLLRFLDTDFSFRDQDGKIEITLKNEKSLRGIPIALPRDKYQFINDGTFYVVREGRYEYVVIGEDVNEKTLYARRNR